MTTADLEKLAPHVRALGFDWIEIPLEEVSDIDPVRGAKILAAEGLGEGAIVIESFTNKVKSIARAAAIWRPLAATQDDLARDGVAFLRRLMA